MTRHYTLDDLDSRTTERQTQDGHIPAHTHTVIFSRALTAPEQQLFARLLCSLYDVVYFSGRFGERMLAEPRRHFSSAEPGSLHTVSEGHKRSLERFTVCYVGDL